MAKVFRCADLALEPDCEYELRTDSTAAVLRNVIDHLEQEHGIYPIPLVLMDSVHRAIKEERTAKT
jgi:predicted small metal-binding protein